MPSLWDETIDAHRHAVRDAILDTTAELVAERGLRSVTMSEIAERAGIGRATLYRYFADVETMLTAWHERQIHRHLRRLADVRDRGGEPVQRLSAVLEAYALMAHEYHGDPRAALLHRGDHMARAHRHLRGFVRDLLAEGAKAGQLRGDVAPDELAAYCLGALDAASAMPSKAAVRRLIGVVLTGLRPDAGDDEPPAGRGFGASG